jgi:hypothetical protein
MAQQFCDVCGEQLENATDNIRVIEHELFTRGRARQTRPARMIHLECWDVLSLSTPGRYQRVDEAES